LALYADDNTLLLSTQWRSQTAVVSVDLTSGQVTPLTPLVGPTASGPAVGADQLASYSLAAVAGRRLLVTKVGPVCPAQLLVADYKPGRQGRGGNWSNIAMQEEVLLPVL
jgi:hypothetical protein